MTPDFYDRDWRPPSKRGPNIVWLILALILAWEIGVHLVRWLR